MNPDRGEIEITLDGKSYPMRPSYTAMRNIESRVGNIIRLYRRMDEESDGLSCDELAIIVTECIKAAGKEAGNKMHQAVTESRVGELIYQEGILYAYSKVTPLLGNMLSGGSKKKEPANETPPIG